MVSQNIQETDQSKALTEEQSSKDDRKNKALSNDMDVEGNFFSGLWE